MDSSEETNTVFEVFTAYKMYVNNVLGGQYHKDILHDLKHWRHVARIVLRHRYSPRRFVVAQFLAAEETRRRGITPHMLYTPASRAISAYDAIAPTRLDYSGIAEMLKRQVAIEMRQSGRTMLAVLENPLNALPPWFRVMSAPELTPKIREWYFEEAKSEALENVDLQEYITREDTYGRLIANTDAK
jgi:hypothetical protein